LSIEQINAIVSPPESVKAEVRKVLSENNFQVVQDGGDFFRVRAQVVDVERLLNTTVFRYRKVPKEEVFFFCSHICF
jgi:hypothetical protein